MCRECISDEYSVIPSFILKHWNFNKFPVSKKAKEILNEWYNKNIIHIKNTDPIFTASFLAKRIDYPKKKDSQNIRLNDM